MDWEPTHTRKRKADWYYSIDPKQRRLDSEEESNLKDASKAHIYNALNSSDMSLTDKVVMLIRANEFEILSEFFPYSHTTYYDPRYSPIKIGQAILDSNNLNFHDLVTREFHLITPGEYLRSTLIPPDLTRFKRLERSDYGPHFSVMIHVIAQYCGATEILEYVLDKYKFNYYECVDSAIEAIRNGCEANFIAILRHIFYKYDKRDKQTFEVLKETAVNNNQKEIFKILEHNAHMFLDF